MRSKYRRAIERVVDTSDIWEDKRQHPDSGIVAQSALHISNRNGVELTVWRDIVPGETSYTDNPDAEAAVEMTCYGRLLFAKAFESEDEAYDYVLDHIYFGGKIQRRK